MQPFKTLTAIAAKGHIADVGRFEPFRLREY
jgi:hypothetical protein